MLHFFRSSSWKLDSLVLCWHQAVLRFAPFYKEDGRAILVGDGAKQAKEGWFMPVEANIRCGISGNSTGLSWADEMDGEAAIYASLAKDLRERLDEYRKERKMLELEQGASAAMNRNYHLFLKCLKELPEENSAGMKMNINGIDVWGSIFWDMEGKAKAGKRSAVNTGRIKVTVERIQTAPDYLRFKRNIYAAFIQGGSVMGDNVMYRTNFGVKLLTVGNSRILGRKLPGGLLFLSAYQFIPHTKIM